MKAGSLCTGIGGLDLAAAAVFDAEPVWCAEIDPYASTVITARVDAPNVGDVRAASFAPVDLITAGFPCQDISLAGKGAGLAGERSGLWFDVLDVVQAVGPRYVVIENVPALANRGLGVVLAGLAAAGYGGAWCYYRSGYTTSKFAHIGACHQRKRLFILAEYGRQGFVEAQPEGGARCAVPSLLPAATASMATGAGTSGREGGLNLPAVAKLLPTPAASSYGSNRGGAAGRVGPVRHGLGSIERLLPTPTVNDSRGGRNKTSGRSNPDSKHHDGTTLVDVAYADTWGEYADAVQRWADIFGHPAPAPVTEDNKLNPEFVEWMLGYPRGWVTDLDIPRTQQLKMLGNSVQPQTATAALTHLLAAFTEGE